MKTIHTEGEWDLKIDTSNDKIHKHSVLNNTIYIWSNVHTGVSKEEALANAKLIKVAPLLLDGLSEALDLVETMIEEGHIAEESIRVNDFINDARRVIEKALR